jgi:hypothetical protein
MAKSYFINYLAVSYKLLAISSCLNLILLVYLAQRFLNNPGFANRSDSRLQAAKPQPNSA